MYRNGCAKEVRKKIKDVKKKKLIYKGNNGSEREDGHHRRHTAEKTAIIWPHQKDARGDITKINYGLDVEFYSKNKFEKLIHLGGFIISIYHDARSPERKIKGDGIISIQ